VATRAEKNDFGGALGDVAFQITSTDLLISSSKPWALAKNTDELSIEELNFVLYLAAENIRVITILLYPFLPYATAQVWQQLGLGDIEEAARKGDLNNLQWGGLKPGTKLGTLAPIFPRADKDTITRMNEIEQSNKPVETKPEGAAASDPPEQPLAPPADVVVAEKEKTQPITIDDFAKIELRVGQIKVAERIPKADKLLRLEVDLGTEQRQILSGIAEWYAPEDLIGRRIVVITNLAPRKMRGLESHGMLLAASEGENGKPVLATFGEEIALGSRLK
jgi:methionyl-tRNA synthetase